jgi:drug/metabolite transporter (DMT)-like permease
VCGLLAAALFGASAPLAKRLLPAVSPLVLSGLLYLGAGLGLALAMALGRVLARAPSGARGSDGAGARAGAAPSATAPAARTAEARLGRGDWLPLLAIMVIGGGLSPWLMLTGLARVPGTSGALLLNLEAPFTMALAVLAFREHMGRHALLASALIVAGGVVLGRPWSAGGWTALGAGDTAGALCIAGACLGWALDNNLSQRLSLKDPRQVVMVKTLGAGTASLLLALLLGHRMPAAAVIAPALALGAASYGASLLLDMHALRILGAAREAAYFATAPFIGAALALPILGERPAAADLTAAALMLTGVALLARERHGHLHTHDPIEHEHLHVHDEHHQHPHAPGTPPGEPHTHRHRHAPLTHDHPHVSDLHHRHRH